MDTKILQNVPIGSNLEQIIKTLEPYQGAYGKFFQEEVYDFSLRTYEPSFYITDFSDKNNIGIPKWVGKPNDKNYCVNFDGEENQDGASPVDPATQQVPEKTVPEEMSNKQIDIDTSKSQWYLEIPKAITAIQFLGNNFQAMEEFCNNGRYRISDIGDGTLKLTDSEGSVIVNPGDYVASLKSGFSVYKAEEFVKNYQYIEKDSDAQSSNPSMNEETPPHEDGGVDNPADNPEGLDAIPAVPEGGNPEQQANQNFSKAMAAVKATKAATKGASKGLSGVKKVTGNIKNSKAFNFLKDKGVEELTKLGHDPQGRISKYTDALNVAVDFKDAFSKLKRPKQQDYQEYNFGQLKNVLDMGKNFIKNVKNKPFETFKDLDKAEGVEKATNFNNSIAVFQFSSNVGSALDTKISNGIGQAQKLGEKFMGGENMKDFKNSVKNISDENLSKGANMAGKGVGKAVGKVVNMFRHFSDGIPAGINGVLMHAIKKYAMTPDILDCTVVMTTLNTTKGLNAANGVNEKLSEGLEELFEKRLKGNIVKDEVETMKPDELEDQTKITFSKTKGVL